MYPEYAVGIRSFRAPSAAEIATVPHCYRNAIHGGKVGEWWWDRNGKKITVWERVTI